MGGGQGSTVRLSANSDQQEHEQCRKSMHRMLQTRFRLFLKPGERRSPSAIHGPVGAWDI